MGHDLNFLKVEISDSLSAAVRRKPCTGIRAMEAVGRNFPRNPWAGSRAPEATAVQSLQNICSNFSPEQLLANRRKGRLLSQGQKAKQLYTPSIRTGGSSSGCN